MPLPGEARSIAVQKRSFRPHRWPGETPGRTFRPRAGKFGPPPKKIRVRAQNVGAQREAGGARRACARPGAAK
eukprot:1460850-Rhodomonas_salina.3